MRGGGGVGEGRLWRVEGEGRRGGKREKYKDMERKQSVEGQRKMWMERGEKEVRERR